MTKKQAYQLLDEWTRIDKLVPHTRDKSFKSKLIARKNRIGAILSRIDKQERRRLGIRSS